MAAKSPEPESKRRKPLQVTKRESQPRVPSRRYPLLQQAPVFETESLLNTSKIQSPSPAKSTVRPPSHTQSRKAFSSGRSLAPTYAATPRHKTEQKPPSSPSSSVLNKRQTSLKPRPTQTSHPAPTPAKNTQDSSDNARLQTPSPVRGRRNPLASPSSSASSPPRGLAEAYQRIVDEEILAHEEAIEDMSGYSDSPTPSEHSLHHDSIGECVNESPTSLKASRRASPHASLDGGRLQKPSFREIYKSLGDAENDTRSSVPASVDSDPSLKGGSQHAKDLRRVNGAMRSEPQIFRKALGGSRAGLTVENLMRNNGSSDSLDSSFTPSVGSRGSDPSFNVPQQWGRKARPGKDWLSRINSKSGRLTGDVPKRRILDESNLPPVKQQDAGNKLAAAAAEIPLPSGDDAASQANSSSRSSTPTAAVLRARSRDRVLEWESREDDFTGRSLQVSESPPIKVRNATLGKILEQEISTVARIAVTTNRLGELREKGSTEQLGRSPSQSRKGDRRHSTESLPQQPASKELKTPSKPTGTLGQGEPVPDTPVVIYRSDSSSSRANEDRLDAEEKRGPTPQRPKHRREDSHSLLRQLARATSASPSSSRDMSEDTPQGEVDTKTAEATRDLGRRSQHQRADHDQEADSKDQHQSSKVEDIEHTTPLQSKSITYLKTPLVTGAWVDTPLPTGGRGPPMPTPNIDDNETKTLRSDTQKLATGDLIRKLTPETSRPKMPDEDLKKTAPRLPRSALESIINAAKAKASASDRPPSPADSQEEPTLLLGESTIHSLEELMTSETDVSALLQPSPTLSGTTPAPVPTMAPSTEPLPQDDDGPPPASPVTAPGSYLTDLQLSNHQLSRLRNLVPSLRETKKGLASLERAVSAPSPSKALTATNPTDTECTEAGEFHDFIWPCPRCGCPAAAAGTRTSLHLPQRPYDYDFDLARISIPVPRLWRWRQPGDWRPRLTWPGVVLVTSFFLYWAEMWARDTYCHKRFAVTMVSYGVDIDAPRPPFVLAKVLWRKLGMGLLVEVVRFWASVLGWIVGFGEGRQPVSRDQRIPRPEWGPDLSMMDDEYL
ncbi:MAG: hypothetical protein Q9178_001513 [Gyalolechia marmorata]